jgi:hypothetical protein
MLDTGGDIDVSGVVPRLAMPLLCMRRTKIERYRRCHPVMVVQSRVPGLQCTAFTRVKAGLPRRGCGEQSWKDSPRAPSGRVLYDMNLRERVSTRGALHAIFEDAVCAKGMAVILIILDPARSGVSIRGISGALVGLTLSMSTHGERTASRLLGSVGVHDRQGTAQA